MNVSLRNQPIEREVLERLALVSAPNQRVESDVLDRLRLRGFGGPGSGHFGRPGEVVDDSILKAYLYNEPVRTLARRTVLDVADAYLPKIQNAVEYAFLRGRNAINQTKLANAETMEQAVRATTGADDLVRATLKKVLPKVLHECFVRGGETGVEQLRSAEFNPNQPRDEQGQWTSTGETAAREPNIREISGRYDAWAQNLSPEEKTSIQMYTETFSGINDKLRQHPDTLDPVAQHIQHALESAPASAAPALVWRGVDSEGAKRLQGLSQGDVVQLNGFQSATINPRVEQLTQTVLEIRPAAGAYIGSLSLDPYEYEFLMPHGRQYRFHGEKTVNLGGKQTRVIQLEMLRAQ